MIARKICGRSLPKFNFSLHDGTAGGVLSGLSLLLPVQLGMDGGALNPLVSLTIYMSHNLVVLFSFPWNALFYFIPVLFVFKSEIQFQCN